MCNKMTLAPVLICKNMLYHSQVQRKGSKHTPQCHMLSYYSNLQSFLVVKVLVAGGPDP